MDSLKTDGYALAVLTNGHADVQRPKLEACGAAELFGGSINGRGEFSRRGKGGNSSKEGGVERRRGAVHYGVQPLADGGDVRGGGHGGEGRVEEQQRAAEDLGLLTYKPCLLSCIL